MGCCGVIMCNNCQVLAQAVRQQQAELKRLNQVIQKVDQTAAAMVDKGEKVMNRKAVPRGEWSFSKGQAEAARIFAKLLR